MSCSRTQHCGASGDHTQDLSIQSESLMLFHYTTAFPRHTKKLVHITLDVTNLDLVGNKDSLLCRAGTIHRYIVESRSRGPRYRIDMLSRNVSILNVYCLLPKVVRVMHLIGPGSRGKKQQCKLLVHWTSWKNLARAGRFQPIKLQYT